MTCIAGVIDGDKVYIGGDSAGVGGYYLTIRSDSKVFKKGEMIFGFTSSFRMGQLLRYKLQIPYHKPDVPLDVYMHTEFIDAVRTCLKEGGYASNKDGEETGGTFLVGYRGRLFQIEDDFQIGENVVPYDAVGCGMELALGSLYSTNGSDRSPEDRVRLALMAAEQFSAGVRGPFTIIST
jgi:hypothetical protein